MSPYSGLIVLLVGQILTAIVFLVGFVAITRRAVDKEIPAKLVEITSKLSEFRAEFTVARQQEKDDLDRIRESLRLFREEYIRTSADVNVRLKYLERRPTAEERDGDR